MLNNEKEIIGKVGNLMKGCYTLDYANNSNKIVFYGGDERCFIVNVWNNNFDI